MSQKTELFRTSRSFIPCAAKSVLLLEMVKRLKGVADVCNVKRRK
jgi:hypothetical protein